ncbi:hypothetical protein KA078_02670 [Candidatus Woesebacteria bacterium]|nr:hypothetical protein [Candidatus Woesebacteria bacterium]
MDIREEVYTTSTTPQNQLNEKGLEIDLGVASKKSTPKTPKALLSIVAVVIIVSAIAGGYFWQRTNGNLSTDPEEVAAPQPIEPTATPLPEKPTTDTSIENPDDSTMPKKDQEVSRKKYRVYSNSAYNFQFNYPDDTNSTKYRIVENGQQISFITTQYYSNGTQQESSDIYTIYDVNVQDKNKLSDWWQQNIKVEIGNYNIKNDYSVTQGKTALGGCIGSAADSIDVLWKEPPSLEVSPKQVIISDENQGPYQGSVYFYYDFGKPFILHQTYESTGACSGPDSYLPLISLKPSAH